MESKWWGELRFGFYSASPNLFSTSRTLLYSDRNSRPCGALDCAAIRPQSEPSHSSQVGAQSVGGKIGLVLNPILR
jgi:hypothetical protein